MKRETIAILSIFSFALVLRLILFSGFNLGDDPNYGHTVSYILKGDYPPFGPHAVFSNRPLLLAVIAIAIRLFGWYDWSFVLPILIASMLNLVIVYFGATRLSGSKWAGIIAALFFATFPLDVVHSTTLSNDILLSSFIWGGSLLLVYSYDKYNDTRRLLLVTLSGFLIGLAIAVKITALVAPLILFPLLGLSLWKSIRQGGYRTLLAWITGWLCANILICGFMYWWSGGDFIAHYHVEVNFNKFYNPSNYIPGSTNLLQYLLLYPNWILGLLKRGPGEYSFMPYGTFFICFLFCIPLAFFRKFRVLRLPVLAGLIYLMVMEFAPLQILPDYIPIHRLPRFLYIASIPAAITIGIAAYEIFNIKKLWLKVCVITLTIFTTTFSLNQAWKKGKFYQDCMQDKQWTWRIVKDLTAKVIVTDRKMKDYLLFRWGYKPPMTIQSPHHLTEFVPPGNIIISGGAREPDLFSAYASKWKQGLDRPYWQTVLQAPYALRPWRPTPLTVALVLPYSADQESESETKILKSQPRIEIEENLRLVSELDIGDETAEKKMNYLIKRSTWYGIRSFDHIDNTVFMDDGRAHQGEESMTFAVTPHQKLIIVKRVDPGVTNQITEVFINNQSAGEWLVKGGGKANHWLESRFIISDKIINSEICNLRFRFISSDCDINSFYYWFYQSK